MRKIFLSSCAVISIVSLNYANENILNDNSLIDPYKNGKYIFNGNDNYTINQL